MIRMFFILVGFTLGLVLPPHRLMAELPPIPKAFRDPPPEPAHPKPPPVTVAAIMITNGAPGEMTHSTQTGDEIDASRINLKNLALSVRWNEEKQADGTRLVKVYFKNLGRSEITDLPLDIILKGKIVDEEQMAAAKVTIARNQEMGVMIPIYKPTKESSTNQFFTIDVPKELPPTKRPITEMGGVEILIGEYSRITVYSTPGS